MKKKIAIISISSVFAICLLFFILSHAIYHRSVMASLAEMAMVIIDRDSIYEEGEKYNENMKLRAVENLQDCGVPDGVHPKISYYDKHEHGMQVFYFNEECFTDTILIYVPGGGYLNNPLTFH